jgi:hypothetical protein
MGPAPGTIFAATFQLEVSPTALAGGEAKVSTLSSKVKSPWKLIRPRLASMFVATTGRRIVVLVLMKGLKFVVGRDTVTPGTGKLMVEITSPRQSPHPASVPVPPNPAVDPR